MPHRSHTAEGLLHLLKSPLSIKAKVKSLLKEAFRNLPAPYLILNSLCLLLFFCFVLSGGLSVRPQSSEIIQICFKSVSAPLPLV